MDKDHITDLDMECCNASDDDESSDELKIVEDSHIDNADNPRRGRKRKHSEEDLTEETEQVLNNMSQEIERQLDAKAAKSNLTVTNVKSILKHIVSNEHVISMVKNTLSDGSKSSEAKHINLDLPLILTRSRTKELLKKSHVAMYPVTPAKNSPSRLLIQEELLEDSSDEEYQPVDEQSDDDKENDSVTSDLDSQPMTPGFAATPSASDVSFTEDGIFKIPQENIGQRTRSKMPLTDTPLETIEQAFIPPDITTDMYDLECDDEEWRNFLKDFSKPLTSHINDTVDDDDEADPEYNILSDAENENVDLDEELRVDRAVKVSKKELKSLFDELQEMISSDDFPEYQDIIIQGLPEIPSIYSNEYSNIVLRNLDNFINTDEVDPAGTQAGTAVTPQGNISATIESSAVASTHPPEVAIQSSDEQRSVNSPAVHSQDVVIQEQTPVVIDDYEDVVKLTNNQRLLLGQQMRKHVQLMTQHFLQTYRHPHYSSFAIESKSFLLSLKNLANSNPHSAFRAENLEGALDVVRKWEDLLSDNSSECQDILRFMETEAKTSEEKRKIKKKYACRFPRQMMDIVSNSEVFIYPLLLPAQAFQHVPNPRIQFNKHENMLIAIAMEQYEDYQQDVLEENKKKSGFRDLAQYIQTCVMPCKDHSKIYSHIRNTCYETNNPIWFFQNHRKAPETTHFVMPYDTKTVRPPKMQPQQLLPEIWQRYIFPHQPPILNGAAFIINSVVKT